MPCLFRRPLRPSLDAVFPLSALPKPDVTLCQVEGEKVETVADFIFLGSQIAVDSDCSHEIQRYLLLGRKALTNLHSVLKSRDHFTNKGPRS